METPLMSSEPSQVQAVFLAAVERPAAERESFLDRECRDNEPLRHRVRALLRAHDDPDSFLMDSPLPQVHDAVIRTLTERPGDVIGPYRLRELIGEGGFGLVFVAEQQQPLRRKVALKVIKPGMDSREVVARFETERQTLALMDHPNVARVLDAGTTEHGRPYFVMELVHGIPITKFCDRQKLPLRERLQLFVDVCLAVQHAHQKGVIHRDIKPTNVLVTLHDGRPVVKVIDFGVAKALNQRLTERSVYTAFGQMIGSPLYMSPEQAEISGLDVDTRADIYSLGVLLYELLTGTTPFDPDSLKEAGLDELRRIIREQAAPRPSARISTLRTDLLATVSDQRRLDVQTLQKDLKGELDWIVMKALEKDRNRRYESASAFADDVGRYIRDEPVQAGPPSAAYRLQKFIHRNKRLVVLGCLIAVFLLCSTIGLGIANVLISRERAEAKRQRTIAASEAKRSQERELEVRQQADVIRSYLYAADMQLAAHAYDNGDLQQTRARLEMHRGATDARRFEWRYLWDLARDEPTIWQAHKQHVFCLAYSPDGSLLASGGRDRSVAVWDARDGTPRARLNEFNDDVNSVAFSDDGRLLATAEEDQRVRVWDWASGCEVARFTDFHHPVADVFLIDNGRRLVATEVDWTTYQGGRTTVWDLATQQLEASVDGYRALALHADSQRLAGCDVDGNLTVWKLPTLETIATWRGNTGRIRCAKFSPDGRDLATGAGDVNNLNLWRLDDLNVDRFPSENLFGTRSLAFTPDGSLLISVTDNGTAWMWDVRNRTKQKLLAPNRGRLWSTAVSPDGNSLAIGCEDGAILHYNLPRMTLQKRRILSIPGRHDNIAIDRRGERIADIDNTTYTVIDARDGTHVAEAQRPSGFPESSIAFSADGGSVWIGGEQGWIDRIDLSTATVLARHHHHRSWVDVLAVSPGGTRVASAAHDGTITVADAVTGRLLLTLDIIVPKTEPESRAIVGFLNEQTLLVSQGPVVGEWDLERGQQLPQRFEHDDWVTCAAISHDGKTLAASMGAAIQLWDISGGQQQATLIGRASAGRLAFSPDGRTLAAGNSQGSIELWDVPAGQVLFELSGHRGAIRQLAFSADARRLISVADTAAEGTEVYMWGVSPGEAYKE